MGFRSLNDCFFLDAKSGMTQSWKSWIWKLGLVSSLAMGGAIPNGHATLHAESGNCAFAQITPDTYSSGLTML